MTVGKTKAWRKHKKINMNGQLHRVGRYYRNQSMSGGVMKGYASLEVLSLMKRAGIPTPEFDVRFEKAKNEVLGSIKESEVENVEA